MTAGSLERPPTSGIYVVEINHGVIKVGQSTDTDRRIATHVRHARGLGADPYRHHVLPVPPQLLREAEREAHAAVRAAGGQPGEHTPEVFTGVYYNPVVSLVSAVVDRLSARAAAYARLRAMSPVQLDVALRHSPDDVAVVVRHAVAS